jgi:hypothetical protein
MAKKMLDARQMWQRLIAVCVVVVLAVLLLIAFGPKKHGSGLNGGGNGFKVTKAGSSNSGNSSGDNSSGSDDGGDGGGNGGGDDGD